MFPHAGEGWVVKRRRRNVVKSDDRAIVRHTEPRVDEGADAPESRHIIECHNCSKGNLEREQVLRAFIAAFITGEGSIERSN